jgi:uncharacterized protein
VTRGVADVNVLVSAAIAIEGIPARVFRAAVAGRWQLVASPHLIADLDEVLHRDKFRRSITVDEAERHVEVVRGLAELVPDPPLPWPMVTRDPDDDYLVALARTANVDFLISGDVHLTELADLAPPVRTPAEFLAMVSEGR